MQHFATRTAKRIVNPIISLVITLSLVLGLSPATAWGIDAPDPTTDCSSIVGEYTYVSNEGFAKEVPSPENTRTFAYNDEWFMGPSSTFNQHLATLSTIACETSVSYYPDELNRDHSQNSKNVEAFLKDLRFEDVAVNDFYNREMLPYSAGVALGHKTIVQDGREYTLLAIVPRSAAYKQEWDGNFDMGTGNTHAGFMAGRDEILRFVRQYVEANGITGDVKVWTCGHSRGSALANLVGAFFAAGGASSYLPGVSVAANDVYAYTFATPTTVKTSGASKGELLSVAAAGSHSSDPRYADETPGAGLSYAGGDAASMLEPHAGQFAGIHNIAPGYDIITLLPLLDWDFTHFGAYSDLDEGATTEQMLEQLQALDAYIHDEYVAGGDAENPVWTGHEQFAWKTFDIDNLAFADDPNAPGELSQADFFAARVRGLTRMAPTSEAYVSSGAQEVLEALAGIYGMNEPRVANVETWTQDPETTAKAGILAYLAYAAERYAEQGIASEDEGVALALEGLISYLTGQDFDHESTTVEEALLMLFRYVCDRVEAERDEYDTITSVSYKTKSMEQLFSLAADVAFPALDSLDESTRSLIYNYILGIDDSMTPEQKQAQLAKFLYTVIDSCVEADSCLALFGLLSFVPGDLTSQLGTIVGTDEYGNPNGSNTMTQLVAGLRETVLVEKDDEGNVVRSYASFAEAADEYVSRVIESAMDAILASGRYDEGTPYYDDLVAYKQTLQDRMHILRMIILDFLLYEEGQPFDTAANVRNISTLISQGGHVPTAHYNEVYLAWMLAKDSAYPAHLHQLRHVEAKAATCTEEGNAEHWQCELCGHYFADGDAAEAIEPEDVVIEPLGHEWGPWKLTKEPTKTAEGEETRVCAHDASHVETRAVPKKDAVTYTITYRLAGGMIDGNSGPISRKYEEGTTITLLGAPKRAGYRFLCWEGSRHQPNDTYVVTEDHTFTAVWEKETTPAAPSSGRGTPVPNTADANVPLAVEAALACTALLLLAGAAHLRKRTA